MAKKLPASILVILAVSAPGAAQLPDCLTMPAVLLPWPAETWPNANDITDLGCSCAPGPCVSCQAGGLSGAFWNSDSQRLYVIRQQPNGTEFIWRYRWDVPTADYVTESTFNKPATGNPPVLDFEAVTQAGLTPPDDNTVYILNENDGTIYELEVGSVPTYGNRWTCELVVAEGNMPAESAAGNGVEGLAFVPDSFLASTGFVHGNGSPYTTSTGGFGGVPRDHGASAVAVRARTAGGPRATESQ